MDDNDFLVLPRILPRGGRLLLGGDTGIGKSFVALNFQKALCTGTPLFGQAEWKCRVGRSLYIEAEIGNLLAERMQIVFKDHMEALKGNLVMSQPEGFSLSHPWCIDWLKRIVVERKIDVLILDPFKDLHFGEENSNTEVSKILQKLREVQLLGTALVILHHYSQPPQGQWAQQYDPLSYHNFRGATVLRGAVDTILTLNRLPGKIVASATDNWKMTARWAKMRHGRFGLCGEDFQLYFNEHGDCSMEYRPEDTGDVRRGVKV